MEQYLEHFGYLAVLVGTMVEGGTLLAMAGFAAHQGYLKMVPWVLLAGIVGNFADAAIFYSVGRWSGSSFLAKRPAWKPRLAKLETWLHSYQTIAIIGFRFLPGLRTLGSFAIGMAKIPLPRFVLLNAIGAVLWTCLVAYTGYGLGRLLAIVKGDLARHEVTILIAMAAVGVVVWWVHRRRAAGQGGGG